MNAKEARKFDKYERETAFMDANAAFYPKDSPGDKVAKSMREDAALVRQYAAGQVAGADEKSLHIDEKADDLEELKSFMTLLDNAADNLEDEFPGIENLFGIPRNRSERSILTAARAQYELSEQYESDFIPYDVPATFRADMLALINRIDAANAAADTSGGRGVGSTGGLKAAIARLGKNSKKLDGINRNKFRGDPVKLGEWITTSHLERDPKRGIEPKTVQ